MAPLAIRLDLSKTQDFCPLCDRPLRAGNGPGICLDSGSDQVCSRCAREEAPALAALLDLARTAERVGQIGRHTLVPPLAELLNLAQAAENYNHAVKSAEQTRSTVVHTPASRSCRL